MQIFVKFSPSPPANKCRLPNLFEQAWLYPCRVISQAAQLCRQAINKHFSGRTGENRKSNRCPCPMNITSQWCFQKIHTGFVSSGAYKQIIGALIIRKKIHEYTSALFTFIDGEKNLMQKVIELLIVQIMVGGEKRIKNPTSQDEECMVEQGSDLAWQ